MSKTILLVGHCGIDGPRLQREVAANLKQTEALRINSEDDLQQAVKQGADLLLINREPLGFEPELGVDLVRKLREAYPQQKMMLVSDFSDAQKEATAAGAMPGFGKSEIGTPQLAETLRKAIDA